MIHRKLPHSRDTKGVRPASDKAACNFKKLAAARIIIHSQTPQLEQLSLSVLFDKEIKTQIPNPDPYTDDFDGQIEKVWMEILYKLYGQNSSGEKP